MIVVKYFNKTDTDKLYKILFEGDNGDRVLHAKPVANVFPNSTLISDLTIYYHHTIKLLSNRILLLPNKC